MPQATNEMMVLSIAPLTLSAPGRATDLHVRVSAPVTGDNLPVLLLSHGHGRSNHLSSLNGYGPLANFWAAHGFVVVQPTHLDSSTLGLREANDPEAPLYWRSRATDTSTIIDQLDRIETTIPQLQGRINRERIAVAGHSMGGHTASLLLGARLTDPYSGLEVDLSEPRISAGVLLAAPGRGGDALSDFAVANYPFFSTTDFSNMSTPALVIAGDQDSSRHLTVLGASWYTDPYYLSPGPKALLTLFGGEHGLGGVAGFDAAETTDEHPARVALVQRATTAYLRSALGIDPAGWAGIRNELAGDHALGTVEERS